MFRIINSFNFDLSSLVCDEQSKYQEDAFVNEDSKDELCLVLAVAPVNDLAFNCVFFQVTLRQKRKNPKTNIRTNTNLVV